MNHSFPQFPQKNQFSFKYSHPPRKERPLSHESFPSSDDGKVGESDASSLEKRGKQLLALDFLLRGFPSSD